MSKLLINESPLQVLPSLAVAIGLNEAIFLQQLHYWLTPTAKYKPHYREYEGFSRPWVYNTYHTKNTKKGDEIGWQANFPFWSTRTIKRIVDSLKQKGLIITTDQFNEHSTNRTLWYTIDYDRLATYESGAESDKLSPSESDKLSPSESDKLSPSRQRLPEIHTETTMPNGTNGTTKPPDIKPTSAKQKPTTKQLTDQQKDELLIFGRHPDSEHNTSFDTVQAIRASGWRIRNHIVEQAIAYYLEAVRKYHPGFAIPNNEGIRKEWYKTIEGHLQDHRVDDLAGLYESAVDKHHEKQWRYSRPGSLTRSLAALAMETQTGDVVAYL